MLNVACVFVGHKYSPEYVHKLHAGVARQMPDIDWGFTVVTDQPELFPSYGVIDVKHLAVPGYWNKICLFMPGAFPDGERVIYFDLDVLITGPLDKMLALIPEPFVIMKDPIYFDRRWNSSVMMWTAGMPYSRLIWEQWNKEGRPFETRLDFTKGDQAWIEWLLRQQKKLPLMWQDEVPGAVRGFYKPNKKGKGENAWLKLEGPGDASVIVFHGRPRFTDEEMAPWVKEMWNGLS